MVELLPRFVEVRPMMQPSFVRLLAQESAQGAVYEIGGGGLALLRQIGHGRPLVGGYVSRQTVASRDFLAQEPLLRCLRGEQTLPLEQIERSAQKLGLRFLIVRSGHKVISALPALGLWLRWRDQGLEVWEIPWLSQNPQ